MANLIFECMVEGHTDNLTYKAESVLLDNWDLSVERATSIVRVKDLDVQSFHFRLNYCGFFFIFKLNHNFHQSLY